MKIPGQFDAEINNPAEERCDLVITIVFHMAFPAARPTIRPLHGMASG